MWIEKIEERNQRSRTYQDSENPRKKCWSGTLACLQYESEIDSGVYDAELDLTPVRVDNPQFDGWRVTANGWHYALGKDLENHGDQDGWVGFGGRQGQNWFKFRLLRLGYLHWPTREWDDIGGSPTYDRGKLSQETHTLTIGPDSAEIRAGAAVIWSDIWTTPGGGKLDVSWRSNGDRLKEEITINQAGREWIEANRPPTTPLDETWFGFVFRLDWSDIPRVLRAGILQNIEGDFADDGEPIDAQDALSQFLWSMPISDVRVPNENPTLEERQPLRKRFWKDNDGNHYLLVGVRCDILNGMIAGDLVFDPTVDKQVVASLDDGTWGASSVARADATWYNAAANYGLVGGFAAEYVGMYARWTGVSIGGTIDVAYAEVDRNDTTGADPRCTIYGEDADNPGQIANLGDLQGRTDTANSEAWDMPTAGGWLQTPSLVSIFQELVDSYTIANDAVQLFFNGTTLNNRNYYDNWDVDTNAPKLHIEYTVAAAGQPMMLRGTTVPHLRQWHPRVA